MATATCDKTCSSMQQETRGQTLMMFMDCSSNPWSNGSCWIIMVDPFPLLLFCQGTLPSSIDSWFVNCFFSFPTSCSLDFPTAHTSSPRARPFCLCSARMLAVAWSLWDANDKKMRELSDSALWHYSTYIPYVKRLAPNPAEVTVTTPKWSRDENCGIHAKLRCSSSAAKLG